MKHYWYKSAIIYSLNVETFMDANGDGVGDFEGLIERLDYLAGLGINCLWLLPFYPSPDCDNGYDVMDYYNVDPRLGTLGDFVEFMHEARERGMRVLIDLVVNHTSKQHPWFQAARTNKNSKYRDYYVWSNNPPENSGEVPYPGEQQGVWEYDDQAKAYYLHTFYKYQPDLNIANPAVQEEIGKIIGFWLELGVSGFRVDAAPALISLRGIKQQDDQDPYVYLEEMREFISLRRSDAVLLAEANVAKEKIQNYFGTGDRMQMLFNFILNEYLFLALAREQAATLIHGLKSLPSIPQSGQWANFLRSHDELNLDKLTEVERQEVFAKFAPEQNMQIYDGRGIRRRLAPMFGNDRRRLEMVYSLLLTLPGTPVLRYGQEIGMGDNLSLSGRESVRTPMQWSSSKNGGFSTAAPEALVKPVVADGEYAYKYVNVDNQRRDPASLLNWMQRMLRNRKECQEFGRGTYRILETKEPSVFAHCCEWQGRTVIAVHNLADKECMVTLDLSDYNPESLVELCGNCEFEPVDGDLPCIQLQGYGYRWFRLNRK